MVHKRTFPTHRFFHRKIVHDLKENTRIKIIFEIENQELDEEGKKKALAREPFLTFERNWIC